MVELEKANEPAEPVAKGILPTCKQAFGDLFIWRQRIEIVDSDGEIRTEWQSPKPLEI